MNIDTVPSLPAIVPTAPAEKPPEPVGAVTPPELPKGDSALLPTAPGTADKGNSLPPLPAMTGDESKLPAEASKADAHQADTPLLPQKTATLPDLAPVPDTAKDALPSLPTGTQKDLSEPSHTAIATPKTDAGGDMDDKVTATDPDMRLVFNETETDVPPSLTGQLDTLAQKLASSPQTHVNIYSYAGTAKESGIYPKRVSLARGIAVRNYLTTVKGIDIERVNVRALGNKREGGPQERVDMFIVK